MGVLALLRPVLDALQSLSSLGFAGQLGYVVGLTIWTILCLPTTPIELTAGFCFDQVTATVTSAAGKTLGNLLALILGRAYLQPFIMRQLSKRSGGGGLHKHLLKELRERPLQMMSVLRAAPMPTPFKLYSLSLFPPELVTMRRYLGIAVVFNSMWSVVWTLAGSSAGSLADIVSGKASKNSTAALVSKGMAVAVLMGLFSIFGRFAASQLQHGVSEGSDAGASSRATESTAPKGSMAMGAEAKPTRVAKSPARAASPRGNHTHERSHTASVATRTAASRRAAR